MKFDEAGMHLFRLYGFAKVDTRLYPFVVRI